MEGKNWGDTESIQYNMFTWQKWQKFLWQFLKKEMPIKAQAWPWWPDVSKGMNPLVCYGLSE